MATPPVVPSTALATRTAATFGLSCALNFCRKLMRTCLSRVLAPNSESVTTIGSFCDLRRDSRAQTRNPKPNLLASDVVDGLGSGGWHSEVVAAPHATHSPLVSGEPATITVVTPPGSGCFIAVPIVVRGAVRPGLLWCRLIHEEPTPNAERRHGLQTYRLVVVAVATVHSSRAGSRAQLARRPCQARRSPRAALSTIDPRQRTPRADRLQDRGAGSRVELARVRRRRRSRFRRVASRSCRGAPCGPRSPCRRPRCGGGACEVRRRFASRHSVTHAVSGSAGSTGSMTKLAGHPPAGTRLGSLVGSGSVPAVLKFPHAERRHAAKQRDALNFLVCHQGRHPAIAVYRHSRYDIVRSFVTPLARCALHNPTCRP